MAEEEAKKFMVEESTEAAAPPPAAKAPPMPAPAPESAKDMSEEKAVIPPAPVEKAHDSKALSVVDKATDPPPAEKSSTGSINRDAVLARVETEKRVSLIRAWEESEKAKAENKAVKKMSAIASWENTQKAAIEAELKTMEVGSFFAHLVAEISIKPKNSFSKCFEEAMEKKKAEHAEKMMNKIAIIHKEAEEKRAMLEAKRGEEILKAEEQAAKYRASGVAPKKLFGYF